MVTTAHADEILEQCVKLGIDTKKLIYVANNCLRKDRNEDYEFVARMLGAYYATCLQNKVDVLMDISLGLKEVSNNDEFKKSARGAFQRVNASWENF